MNRLRLAHAAMVLGALVVVALVVVALSSGGGNEGSEPLNRPSSPIVINGDDVPRRTVELTAAQRASARRSALVFARSYIPVLYGRAEPAQLVRATRHLRRSLREARRPPVGVRRRHAQLRGLELTVQSERSIVATATVWDGVAAPFRVVFTVELRDGRWVVSDLASD